MSFSHQTQVPEEPFNELALTETTTEKNNTFYARFFFCFFVFFL